MTTEGIVMLRLLAEWRTLPRREREANEGATAVSAESCVQGDHYFATSYAAVFDVSTLAAPIPCPFVYRRGAA